MRWALADLVRLAAVRVAVVSDVHSNLAALEAVLDSMGSVDALWHLGDIVGYGAEPDGVVERLEAAGAVGVRGNHDAAAIGLLGVEWFNREARLAMEWTRRTIGERTRAWLAALPERRADGELRLVHGSFRDPTWEYVTTSAVARANLVVLAEDGGRIGLHGHTHVPIVFADRDGQPDALAPGDGALMSISEGVLLLNPGSVGQPRDGDERASWLELNLETLEATWHRVAYDVERSQAAIRAAGLPDRLADRLAYGI